MADIAHMEPGRELRRRHPRFRGNWKDLLEFEQLASSPIRSDMRSAALTRWSDYKLQRQREAYRAFMSQRLAEEVLRGELTASAAEQRLAGGKGAYIRSLTHRAIDLTGADLIRLPSNDYHSRGGICIGYIDLRGAILDDACLQGAWLKAANLENASMRNVDLTGARLPYADLRRAVLVGGCLAGADLSGADFTSANLSDCKLHGADLKHASLVGADLTDAVLTGCHIHGISAWRLRLTQGTKQQDLVITDCTEPAVTVDNIEVAQFVYLLLHNEKIGEAIDTISKKGVLLLGRFTGGRITILEQLRQELRRRDLVPMVFNFDKPETKNFTETVRLLAGLSRFVIVDITNPRSAPLELQATVPECMVPFVPILEEGEKPFAMLQDLWIMHPSWVLDPIEYPSINRLIEALDKEIIEPAEARFAELLARKAEKMKVRKI